MKAKFWERILHPCGYVACLLAILEEFMKWIGRFPTEDFPSTFKCHQHQGLGGYDALYWLDNTSGSVV